MSTRHSRIVRFIHLETLVVGLRGQIGLLRVENGVGCTRNLFISPSYFMENPIASHACGRSGAALISREGSRGILARLIFA